jgi:hypothetical protein
MQTRRPIPAPTLDQIVERVRREYAALPGLRLTERQACRIWGLEPALSAQVLRHLVDGHFLTLTARGEYVRADVRGSEVEVVGAGCY